ncbi:MAG: hypothetical protein IJ190_07805 [Prevotella sp.]|nr:hypothetical protein [Prevotella sp.]
MKKCILNFLIVSLLIFVSVAVISCGGEDDPLSPKPNTENPNGGDSGGNNNNENNNENGNNDENVKQMILGTWKCTHNSTDYTVITFNSDGNSNWIYRCEDDIEKWTLPYEITTQLLIFKENGVNLQYTYSLNDTSLIFDGDEYYKIDNYVEEDDPDDETEDSQMSADTEYANRGTVAKQFRGSGTSSDPYIISDATELRKLADDVESGKTYRDEYFKMTADVIVNRNVLNSNGTLKGTGTGLEQWKPIGKGLTPFCGTFDGNGHTISGIYIKKEERDSLGLFGYFAGTLSNLVLNDSYVAGKSRNGCMIGVASYATYSKTYAPKVSMCINYGTAQSISGSYLGGIIGYSKQGDIHKCINYGVLNGYRYVGGVVGFLGASTAKDCVNCGSIKGDNHVGGIIGEHARHKIDGSWKYTNLKNCYNTGNVSATTNRVGGIIGTQTVTNSTSGLAKNMVNYGSVIILSNNSSIGALVGYANTGKAIFDGYFLETTYPKGVGGQRTSGGTPTNIQSMTSSQMKSKSFLDELNKNAQALGSTYSKWKFGKDGYPILEWVNE